MSICFRSCFPFVLGVSYAFRPTSTSVIIFAPCNCLTCACGHLLCFVWGEWPRICAFLLPFVFRFARGGFGFSVCPGVGIVGRFDARNHIQTPLPPHSQNNPTIPPYPPNNPSCTHPTCQAISPTSHKSQIMASQTPKSVQKNSNFYAGVSSVEHWHILFDNQPLAKSHFFRNSLIMVLNYQAVMVK